MDSESEPEAVSGAGCRRGATICLSGHCLLCRGLSQHLDTKFWFGCVAVDNNEIDAEIRPVHRPCFCLLPRFLWPLYPAGEL